MKKMSVVAFLIVSLMALVFSGCTLQLEQPVRAPEAQVNADATVDYKLNPELLFLERTRDAGIPTEGLAAVDVENAVDYRLNPELRFLERAQNAGIAVEEFAIAVGSAPASYVVTEASQLIGEWICEEEDGQMLIRMDPDGRIIHVLGPNDAVDIGYFWFSDGAFHVISDVDNAANESVFHVGMETGETGTFLRFAQCGGNCPNAGDIEWLNGLTRS
jgi:hypothetical protein